MDFESPLTWLVWITSVVSVALTYMASWLLIPDLGDGTLWWKLSTIITCGTLAGAVIPELVKVFTSTESRHVAEVVESSREGGASLNILSGLVAGNFSAFWLGSTIMVLMAAAYAVSLAGLGVLMVAPAVFAFGLVAFGFLAWAGHDRGRLVRPGDRQRAVGLRAVAHRADSGIKDDSSARTGSTWTSPTRSTCSRTTTARATRSRRPPSPCSSARPSWAPHHDLLDRRAPHPGLTTNLERLSIMHPPFLLG